jgi:hypothetical protein
MYAFLALIMLGGGGEIVYTNERDSTHLIVLGSVMYGLIDMFLNQNLACFFVGNFARDTYNISFVNLI